MEPKRQIETVMLNLWLEVRSEFVPFSQSRNARDDAKLSERSLNWRVTIIQHYRDVKREILTTDYSAGIARCPGYKANSRPTLRYADLIEFETENGFPGWNPYETSEARRKPKSKRIEPDRADVMHSLILDCDALNYATFEEWADNFGYDSDSRKAEAIYRHCIELALKLHSRLSLEELEALRKACENY